MTLDTPANTVETSVMRTMAVSVVSSVLGYSSSEDGDSDSDSPRSTCRATYVCVTISSWDGWKDTFFGQGKNERRPP